MKKLILFSCFCLMCCLKVEAQAMYGTTGLLHMPTADMQEDKTFMFGGNAVDVHTLPRYWSESLYKPFTFNYYMNITFFPWLEVAYTCTLVKGAYGSSYWPEKTWGKFCNQDRSFHGRLRLWKEGWWKDWTPQIVLGMNDPGSHEGNGGGDIDLGGGGSGNHNYLTRYYLAATKHVDFQGVGQLGVHAAFVIGNAMTDEHYKRPAFGVNFQFNTQGEGWGNKMLNGLNLMAEYDARTFNVGGSYRIWKDHINLIAELNDGKYFSGGIFFKVHLK